MSKECIRKLESINRVSHKLDQKENCHMMKIMLKIKCKKQKDWYKITISNVMCVEKNGKLIEDYLCIIKFIYLMLKNKILNAKYVKRNLKQECY